MNYRRFVRTFAGACIIVLSPVGAFAATGAQPNIYAITAGSGEIGIHDGPALQASFMMPTAMAAGANGTVYIVDTAAQRIRALDRMGRVTTIAGGGSPNASGIWVDGGYTDGSGLHARFNRPMGIAVDKHGAVYIADTGNHCIRRIVDGTVTTFAGVATQAASTDGPVGAARFNAPRALAFDKAQNLYVADALDNKVRVISPSGIVSTVVTGPLMGPSGLSVGKADGHERLWITDRQGIESYEIPAGGTAWLSAYPKPTDSLPPLNAGVMLGRPQAIAALENDEIVYTDATDSSVKYLRGNQYLKYLGQTPREDAMLTGGGPSITRDGPRWNSPLGIIKQSDGSLIVADTGNRRLIHISAFDRRQALTIDDLGKLSFAPREYRVAIVGSSFVWYSTDFPDSIAGRIESGLSADASLKTKFSKAHAVYFRLGSFQGELDLIRNVLSEGTVDLVVWVVSSHDGEALGGAPAVWAPALRKEYEKTAQALRQGNTALAMMVLPPSISLSPLESVELYNRHSIEASDYTTTEAAMHRAVYGLDASVLDLYPLFRREIRGINHRPLYASDDLHLTPYGRELAASAEIDQLTRIKPWMSREGK